ncbi:MAG: hypothetical protein LUG84_03235 [Akkermansiaceae bacterium]|nr:hypothetical protein [Akkermansiaceae bacterium]
MKTYLLPLLGAAALALSQCGGSSGEYSTFSMSAASFANTTKQFVFHNGSGYGYCRIKPTADGWYLKSLSADSDDDSDTVYCNAYLIYEESAMGENPSSSMGSMAEVIYTYFGDGTGSLTITSAASNEAVAGVLFGAAGGSVSTSTTGQLSGQVDVIFTGDGAGTYTGNGVFFNDSEGASGSTSGDFRLYRGNY